MQTALNPNPKDDLADVPTIKLQVKDNRVQSYQQQRHRLNRRPIVSGPLKSFTSPNIMISDQPRNKSNTVTPRVQRSHRRCLPSQFECKGKDQGRCLSLHNLCDGVEKCSDGYDEIGCPDHPEKRRMTIERFDLNKFSPPRLVPRLGSVGRREHVYQQEHSIKKEEEKKMNCQCTCSAK